MQLISRSWVFVPLLTAFAGAASDDTTGAFVDSQGILRIYGNSFGRPGYNDTYDYIVVGGGNAGNTIAARLALDPAGYSVAVIEAGSFYEIVDGNRTQVPGYNYINTIQFPLGPVDTPTTWGLTTVPQPGQGGRISFYSQGQTFGGGTAANYMGYQRGTKGTFDQWAHQVDDDFWKWDNVYPAYKKSVTFQPPDWTKIDPSINVTYDPTAFTPTGGPLHVSYGNHQGAYGPSLNDALEATGFQFIDGFNSGKLFGYSAATATIDTRTATRDSSETSFLQEAARKSSIKIYPQALARRILFNEQKRAVGVEVQTNTATADLRYFLSAKKEVIISAGVWHSPQLLMVSGVGPAATLQQHGINVVADLPGVGQNEWDQPVVGIFLDLNVTTNTQLAAGNPQVVASAIEDYLEHQSGPLSGFGTGQGIAFEKFPDSHRANFSNSTLGYLKSFPSDWPEVEYLPLANAPLIGPVTPENNFLILTAVLLATESKGNITISGSDILDKPIINPNWLGTKADIEQAYAAVLRLREIASHWDAVVAEILPGQNVTSKEDLVAFIVEHSGFIFHGACSCKMGPAYDKSAVVDSRARVHGVTGLRVVDASAFPSQPPGHPMSSVYMFAEKIADSILAGN